MDGRHISKKCKGRIKVNQAFTIVELLVVILVVGILSAVTFVAYNGVQNSAAETALKSDLQAAAAASVKIVALNGHMLALFNTG